MKTDSTSIKGILTTSLSFLHKCVRDFTAFQPQQKIQLEFRFVFFIILLYALKNVIALV